MEIQGKTSLAIRILVSCLAPIILYWQDFVILANEVLHSDLLTHILAIPFILTYLFYRIRKMFVVSVSNQFTGSTLNNSFQLKDIIGTLLCLLAYLIKWVGSSSFQPLEYHIASLPIFVAGIVLIVFNAQTLRILVFPIALLTFLIPPPLELAQSAGSALATFSTQAAYNLLKTMRLPVSVSSKFGSPVILLKLSEAEIPFNIDIACSGIYSLIGFVLFAIFTAYITRGPLLEKFFVLSLGFPLIFALNILRITLIVIIGYYFGANLALKIFHLLGGWTLIFVGTIILLIIAEKLVKIQIFSKISETCPYCNEYNVTSYCIHCGKILKTKYKTFSKTDAIKLSLILGITISLFFVQVPVFTLTEGAAEVFIQKLSERQTAIKVLPEVEGYELRFFYRDVAFENASGQDASLMYQYLPKNPFGRIIWVGLEIGPTKGHLHYWEVCLITWPQTHGREVHITQLDLKDIHLLDNPPLSGRYFVFQENNERNIQVILYWYIKSIFKTEEGYHRKWTKISVIAFSNDPYKYQSVEEELLPIAKAIVNYWKPINIWSIAALAIAKYGLSLISITAILIIGMIVLSIHLERNKRRGAKLTYGLISDPEDHQILDTIKGFKKGLATVYNIASKYKDDSSEEIDMEILYKKLIKAEKAGLIEIKIININNEPYTIWKQNF